MKASESGLWLALVGEQSDLTGSASVVRLGVYYPDEDPDRSGPRGQGLFQLEIVDGDEPGYSEVDCVCFSFAGGLERYKLPARDDVDGDGLSDEGCSYIGGGTIRINLKSTASPF